MKKLAKFKYIFIILLAAIIYSFNVPLLSLIGNTVPPFLKSSLMYLGAIISMFIVVIYQRFKRGETSGINKKNIKYVILNMICESCAAITFIIGISKVSSETSSLLMATQTLLTAFIALFMFKERIGVLGWIGIACIMGSTICLNISEAGFVFNEGIIYVIASCLFWSLSNNIARKSEGASPYYLVLIKSFAAFCLCLIVSRFTNETFNLSNLNYHIALIGMGFMIYGVAVSMVFLCQIHLGVSICISYFGINPFIGSLISIFMFNLTPYFTFYISMALILVGMVIITINQYRLSKKKLIK